MENKLWDVIVVGGGFAGLATAIMCGNGHLNTLILEGGKWGGLLARMYPHRIIPNYPGFPEGIKSMDLVRRWLKQVKQSNFVTMKRERVISIEKNGVVKTIENEYHGKTVVIATGTRPRELGIPGEGKFNQKDRGVYYYPTDKEKFIDSRVLVVGGGDTAVDAALDLVDLAKEITIIHRKDRFRALDENVHRMEEHEKITILLNTEIEKIDGGNHVERVVLVNNKTGESETLQMDSVILAVGLVPNAEIFRELGVAMDDDGYIITDENQQTSVEGVFAVGDVAKVSFRLLVVGAAQAAVASRKIYEYIKRPYWAGEHS